MVEKQEETGAARRYDEYPSISHRQYLAMKKSLKRKEKYNSDKIYLIPCEGKAGWCEAAEHSALFYYYEVAARLGLNNQFFADTLSLYDGYEIGYVRIRDVETAIEMVKRADMYLDEGRDSQRTFYIELKKPFSDDKIQHYIKKEKQRRVDQMVVAPAQNLAPEFYQMLIGVGARVHRIINSKLDRLTTDTVGEKIVELLDLSLEHYHYLTYIPPENIEAVLREWEKIRKWLNLAIVKMKVLSDLKLLKYETCLDIVEVLEHLVSLTEQAKRRAEKKAVKAVEKKEKKEAKRKEKEDGARSEHRGASEGDRAAGDEEVAEE